MSSSFAPRLGSSSRVSRIALACALSAMGSAAVSTARADDQVAATSETIQLAPVTVTARKADEQIKDVPFALTVIEGADLQQRRLDSLQDVLVQTPGVDFQSYGDSNVTLRIRGVGTLSKVSSEDSSVMIYVDGQPQPMSSSVLTTLDVERVEVLKGPQGTLYGRNSEAGAVNIVTRQPTRTLEGHVRTEIGTEGHRLGEAAVGGPLTEALSGRLALRYAERDYPITNVQTGDPLTNPDDLAVRGTLLWEPAGSDTSVTLTLAHEQANDRAGAMALLPFDGTPVMDAPPGSFDDDLHNSHAGLTVKHAFDWAVLTSQTGVTATSMNVEGPFYEGLTYQRLLGFKPQSFRQYLGEERSVNQELRLSSLPDDPVFWVAGVNVFRMQREIDTRNVFDQLNPANPFNADIDRDFATTSGAVFGEVTYPLTDALKITGGLRQTWERKTYDAEWRANASNPSPLRLSTDSDSFNDTYTTGRASLAYDITPETTVYATYSRGYKSGGYGDYGSNIAYGMADEPYEAATVDSYEIGTKNVFDGGRLTLNAAVYFNDIKGDHLYAFDPVTYATRPENVDTRTMGAELDGAWAIGGGFTVSGGVAYTRAVIESDNLAAGIVSGNDVPNTARWSTQVSLLHETELPGFLGISNPLLSTRLSHKYLGERPADPQNNFDLSDLHKIDLRVGLLAGSTEIYLWGDNLLDEHQELYGYYYPAMMAGGADARFGAAAAGRSFGLGVHHVF